MVKYKVVDQTNRFLSAKTKLKKKKKKNQRRFPAASIFIKRVPVLSLSFLG